MYDAAVQRRSCARKSSDTPPWQRIDAVFFAAVRDARLAMVREDVPVILIPNAVIEEVRAGQDKDRTAAAALKWAEQYRVENATVVASIEHWDLGAGESQVIAHSLGTSKWAVLDDRAARRCALAHGIPVIGSLGVVLRSKKNGNIDYAPPLMEHLSDAGMFMDNEFIDRVLDSVGE